MRMEISTSQELTIKVDRAYVLEEHPSLHRVHLLADTHGAGTQVHVHAVQGVGHGVHSVNYKLHLALLLILRVSADSFVTWQTTNESKVRRSAQKISQLNSMHTSSPICQTVARLPVHFLRLSSYFMPGRVSLHLKSSSQNSANQMFLLLFSRDLEVKYWSNPESFHKQHYFIR